MIVICAWCNRFQGYKEPMEDKQTTHTICAKCAEREREGFKRFPKDNRTDVLQGN